MTGMYIPAQGADGIMEVWDSTQKGIHMENYNTMPIEELVKNSRIRLEICDVEVDMYWKVAMEVLGVIADNNRAGKTTFMVVPYGPLGPYARIAYLVNKYRISLRDCVFCNMDEYIGEDGDYIPKDDRKGSIAPGKDADLVLMDRHFNVRAVFLAGQRV